MSDAEGEAEAGRLRRMICGGGTKGKYVLASRGTTRYRKICVGIATNPEQYNMNIPER